MKDRVKEIIKFTVKALILGFLLYCLILKRTNQDETKFFNTQGPFMLQRLVFTDFYNERQGRSYQIEVYDDIMDICGLLETGRRTDIDSVSGLPRKNRVTVVQFFTSPNSGGRVCLYKEKGKEYVDQPFEKLYELPQGSLQKIRNIYMRRGTVVEIDELR